MEPSRPFLPLFRIGLLCILLLLPGSQALSGDAVMCGSEPIRVGFFRLGYRYYVENGQEKGMNVDILEEFKRRTGCTFLTQEMSFSRIYADLESGELDMSLSGIWSQERDRIMWCAPSITSKNYAVLGDAARASVKSAEDFLTNRKLQFGVVRGYTHGKGMDSWLKKVREEGRVEESANVDILFEKLKLGRIDGIFSFPFVYRKFISDLKLEKAVSVQDWFPEEKGIIGCTMLSKKRFSEEAATKWREFIREIQKDGTLKSIFLKYVSETEAVQMLDF